MIDPSACMCVLVDQGTAFPLGWLWHWPGGLPPRKASRKLLQAKSLEASNTSWNKAIAQDASPWHFRELPFEHLKRADTKGTSVNERQIGEISLSFCFSQCFQRLDFLSVHVCICLASIGLRCFQGTVLLGSIVKHSLFHSHHMETKMENGQPFSSEHQSLQLLRDVTWSAASR